MSSTIKNPLTIALFVAISLAVACGGSGSIPTVPDPSSAAVATTTPDPGKSSTSPNGPTPTPVPTVGTPTPIGAVPTSPPTAPPPTATATQTGTATATPTNSTPTPPEPTVSIAPGTSSCHPKSPSTPCTIAMAAIVKDGAPPFTYSWSGCATGSIAGSTCNVNTVGSVGAAVVATDSLGRAAYANISVTGANNAPTVTVSGGGPCHPKSGAPCTFSFSASATDADGDALSYTWSGCTSGNGKTATCTGNTPGTYAATVTVADGFTSSNASWTSTATNAVPIITVTGGGSCHPVCSQPVTASVSDPDGDAVSIAWSGCATGSGGSATCAVNDVGANVATATVTDEWGATKTASVTSTGTDTPPVCGWMGNPSYSGTEVGFNTGDGDGDTITSCTVTCANGCCQGANCRNDLSPKRVYYKNAAPQIDGTPCVMTITLNTEWGSGSANCSQQFLP